MADAMEATMSVSGHPIYQKNAGILGEKRNVIFKT